MVCVVVYADKNYNNIKNNIILLL